MTRTLANRKAPFRGERPISVVEQHGDVLAQVVQGHDVEIPIAVQVARDQIGGPPHLLEEIRDLGITLETGAALLLAPLVQVAWAEGMVTEREREAVLELAALRGVEAGSPAYDKLVEWLDDRPPAKLFDTALKTIDTGLSVLPLREREQRLAAVANACKHVAMAGGVTSLFGLGGEISRKEAAALDAIAEKLHSKRGAGH